LEGAPLIDYGDFEATHFIEIIAWRDFYALNYADVFGGVPKVVALSNKGKDNKARSKPENKDQKLG
jgi:hypothetical protein